MVGIVSWGSYIPRYRIRIKDIAQAWGKDRVNGEKSVPGIDEDTVTMAVEAAKNAVHAPQKIGAVYIGSESHPYAVKPTGTIVAEALGIRDYTAADFEFACKAGTAAMQVGLSLVSSGMADQVLIGGSDTAQAKPGDVLEYTAAAGSAMFVIAKDEAVTINKTVSFTTDTPDFWRRAHEKYPSHGGSFTGEPAYYRHVMTATKKLMEQSGTSPEDYDYVVFHQPNYKFPTRAAKRLGFSQDQYMPGLLVHKIGNTYSASSLLGLCVVLDNAKAGDRILLTSYGSGSGSDSFDMTVTENIEDIETPSVSSYMDKKIYIDYPHYLRYTRQL